MGSRKKKREPVWEQAERMPRAGLPDAVKLTRRARILRVFVWATVVLAPFVFLLALAALTQLVDSDESAAAPQEYPQTRSEALHAVTAWLETEPSPLPGGRVVSWDKMTVREGPASEDSAGEPFRVEAHHLTLASAGGTLFDSVVALGVSEGTGAVLVETPSLLPRAPSADSWSGSIWPRAVGASAGERVSGAIEAWAEAFSSGDPDKLLLAVRDSSPNSFYVPLMGAKLSEPRIGEVAAAEGSAVDSEGDPTRILVHVTFDIEWHSRPIDDLATRPTVSYDLLVDEATTAPVVVAWGGPGSGPGLEPYSNAVKGRQLVLSTPDGEAEEAADGDPID